MISNTETTDLYFGYGSNLDWQDWEKWCNEHGKDPNSIEALPGIYLLPDYELAFDYCSIGRRGGVLDVVKKRGHVVVGKLFKVSKEGFDALDEKEGVPVNVYEQKTVQVLGEDGKSHNVITYVVTADKKTAEHQTPTEEYVQVVLRGYDSHGITEKYPWAEKQLLESRRGHAVRSTANHIFTYGTLREGEERSHIIAEFSEKMYKDCKVTGNLINLGSYPGLIRTMTCKNCDEEIELDDGYVMGEVHHTPKIQNALKTLDEDVEGFRGYGEKNSLYHRILVQCDDKLCWTYLWAGSPDDGTVIESGDWCKDD